MMSASAPIPASKAQAMQIPSRIKHPVTGHMIPLSSTPGGSLYGTTPGGTRISYSRDILLHYKNSPLSKSPAQLPSSILALGCTTEHASPIPEEKLKKQTSDSGDAGGDRNRGDGSNVADDEMFEME